MYTTLDINAELQKQLGYIADDENSLKKVLAFVKELIAQQTLRSSKNLLHSRQKNTR